MDKPTCEDLEVAIKLLKKRQIEDEYFWSVLSSRLKRPSVKSADEVALDRMTWEEFMNRMNAV